MVSFKVGDKVRQISEDYPGENGDVFTVVGFVPDITGMIYVRRQNGEVTGGWCTSRFEKADLPPAWAAKIEATLGREALVALGVAEPLPSFEVGDRVAVAHDTESARMFRIITESGKSVGVGGRFGTVTGDAGEDGIPVILDDEDPALHLIRKGVACSYIFPASDLLRLETVTTTQQAIQVQFHVEGGSDPARRASNTKQSIERHLEETGLNLREGTSVTATTYPYTHTAEVLSGTPS